MYRKLQRTLSPLVLMWMQAYFCAFAQDYYHAVILTPQGQLAQNGDPVMIIGSRPLGISSNSQEGHVIFIDQSNTLQLQAALWINGGQPPTLLHPQGFSTSIAVSIWGNNQVGYGFYMNGLHHALLWNGSSSTTIDLHPEHFVSSNAFDIKANVQVGRGHRDIATKFRALMWQGSAQSMVDLHPDNLFEHTEAHGVNETGSIQVGFGIGASTNAVPWALMWNNSASSYSSLHHSLWEMSMARDVSGSNIVGEVWETVSVRGNAMLWQNAGTTHVNLHPGHTNFSSASWANAINGGIQVGAATNANGTVNAFLWRNTSLSAVNLNGFLPCYSNAEAMDVDEAGNVIGYAWNPSITCEADEIVIVLWKKEIAGDVNGDGCVDDSDLIMLFLRYGQYCSGSPEDINGDGIVDDSDLLILLSNFGQGNCPS